MPQKPNNPWDPYDPPPGQEKKPQPVPEPAVTGALVLGGAFVLLAYWRWKRLKNKS